MTIKYFASIMSLLFSNFLITGLVSAAEPQGRFGGTVDVRVVNVEAVVTDQSGARVEGLGPADFRLLVDGQVVGIDYFTEVRSGNLAPPAGPANAASQPPAAGGVAVGDAVATNYLVYIDEFFALPTDRDRAVGALIDGLPRLGPSDSMAVVAYDGKRIQRLISWTSSHDELREALTAAMGRRTGGILRRIENETVGSNIEDRQLSHQLKYQVSAELAAASSAMRASRPPEGRRVMLLLAGGWPIDPSLLLPVTGFGFAEYYDLRSLRQRFLEVANTANLLGYTLYPVDMPGLEAAGLRDVSASTGEGTATRILDAHESAASRGQRRIADLPGTLTNQLGRPPSPFEREHQNEAGLRLLAADTGGEPVINSGVSRAFELTVADTRTYYWLGYSAAVARDDVRHDIAIEVTRPGLEVRNRSSFVDLSRERETTMLVESALLFADGMDVDESGLVVSLGSAKRHGLRKTLVPIEVQIPIGTMMAVATAHGYDVRIELRVGVIDDKGYPSDIHVIPVVFSGSTAPDTGAFGTYSGTLELKRGAQDLLVTAYDPAYDQLLATRVKVDL